MIRTTRHGSMIAAALLALVTLLDPAARAEAQQIRVKWSHALPVGGTMGVGATEFAEAVNARMRDRVKVEVFPAAQLYKSLDGINALRRGEVHIVHEGNAYLTSLVPQAAVFELPFLFDSWEQGFAAIDGPIGEDVFKRLESKNVKIVANFALAFYDVVNSKRPVKTLQDLKGLKIRALGRTSEMAFKELGASTVSISASEIYTALASGVMDGVLISPVSIWDRKLYEVQKYLTISHQMFVFLPVMVNAKFWDSLPADVRSGLDAIMKEVEKKQRARALAEAENYVAKLRGGGMDVYVLPKAERDNWKKAVAPVYDAMAPQIGRDLIQRAQDLR